MRLPARILAGSLAAGLLVIGLGTVVPAEPPGPVGQPAPQESLKPRWRVGEQWIVETTTRLVQTGADFKSVPTARPIDWQFTVKGIEKIAGRSCYRLEIRPQDSSGPQPITSIWVDDQTQTLRRVQTQLPVQGELRTITENYEFGEGKPSPVLGPLTALPIDMPLFGAEHARSLKFSYTAVPGAAESRELGEIGFAVDIEQHIAPVKGEEARNLLHRDLSRDLRARPLVEVRLQSPERKVRQLWQAGLPWPSYSDNGDTSARLIKVFPPANQ